jgi:hypothetical protein
MLAAVDPRGILEGLVEASFSQDIEVFSVLEALD